MALIGTLGMFIIDTFSFYDPDNPEAEPTDRGLGKQLGGGGTYFIVGSRVFCEPQHLLMVIDRGQDFPQEAQQNLDRFASTPEGTESGAMWKFRDREGDVKTTMAVNIYRGEHRGRVKIQENRLIRSYSLIRLNFIEAESVLIFFHSLSTLAGLNI